MLLLWQLSPCCCGNAAGCYDRRFCRWYLPLPLPLLLPWPPRLMLLLLLLLLPPLLFSSAICSAAPAAPIVILTRAPPQPLASSRGRGIRMVTKPSAISSDTSDCLVQQYIHDPLTIHGFKFDMRIYVAVTSFDPLRAYVYPDGLARFATQQYSTRKSSLKCVGFACGAPAA
jgi:hypothetical protein